MTRLPKFWRPREESSEVKPAIRPAPRGLAPTVAGLLVGVQAALLSWVVVVIPTVATFTTTSGLAVNAGVSWADAGRFGSSLWVLGHGGWTVVGQGASSALVSVSPLGIALISVLACAALSHATAARGWPLVLGGLAGFLAMAVLVVLVLGRNQSGAAPAALFGAAVTALVGLLWGNQPHNGELLGRWRELLAAGIAPEVMAALRAAGLAALVLLAASSGLILILVLGGQGRFRELFNSLGADPVGAVALILLSAALIPNLLAWGVAYLSGLGFVVGQGTGFSPFHTWGGAEPAWPI
ncbi:MAG: DUF6350 family protein, partial [Bifidobacteriaceae bacterium]|nr:DUF6350 family protein [Bifidobacteriaceae bacterium]